MPDSTYTILCAGIRCTELLEVDKKASGWESLFCEKCKQKHDSRRSAKVCECGADKIKYPWHSSWCPVYKDPMGNGGK